MRQNIFLFSSIVCGIAGVLAVRHYLLQNKDRKVSDLWNEILNFTTRLYGEGLVNARLLNDALTGNKERLNNIVEYCDLQLASKTKKSEILNKIKQIKSRAERLQKWYVIW